MCVYIYTMLCPTFLYLSAMDEINDKHMQHISVYLPYNALWVLLQTVRINVPF